MASTVSLQGRAGPCPGDLIPLWRLLHLGVTTPHLSLLDLKGMLQNEDMSIALGGGQRSGMTKVGTHSGLFQTVQQVMMLTLNK